MEPITPSHPTTLRESPMSSTTADAARWNAVLARDPKADGAFVFAVRTTGVYCRPSCAARRPHRANVAFYPGPDDAERAGFRACRRCHPREASDHAQQVALVRTMCEALDGAGAQGMTLEQLGRRMGYSRWHLHRMFRRIAGITPRQYARGRRTAAFRAALRTGARVTDAVYEAGFGAPSRAYEALDATLGMTPGAYGRGGRGMRIGFAIADLAIGRVLVAGTARGLCAVRIGGSASALERGLREEFPEAVVTPTPRALRAALRAVARAAAGRAPDAALPLDVRATAFQRRVWEALQAIPAGETRTYAQLARAVGRPRAARAVGRACATNPVALLVPCHRAVRGDGGLGGYAWGLRRKRALLDAEAGVTSARARSR